MKLSRISAVEYKRVEQIKVEYQQRSESSREELMQFEKIKAD